MGRNCIDSSSLLFSSLVLVRSPVQSPNEVSLSGKPPEGQEEEERRGEERREGNQPTKKKKKI